MKTTFSFYTFNIALLVLASAFSQLANAEGVYKWVDEKGNVTYQSSPPPEGATEIEQSNINIVSGDEEVEQPAAYETDPIKFYSKPECPTCDQARTYFEEMEIPFEEVDVSEDTAAAEKMKRNFGHNNVPTVKVGNKSVTGYQENTMAKVLKSAGYNIPDIPGEDDATEVLETGAPAEDMEK